MYLDRNGEIAGGPLFPAGGGRGSKLVRLGVRDDHVPEDRALTMQSLAPAVEQGRPGRRSPSGRGWRTRPAGTRPRADQSLGATGVRARAGFVMPLGDTRFDFADAPAPAGGPDARSGP
jgi:hypothetical protein